jgi:hypothetical protein
MSSIDAQVLEQATMAKGLTFEPIVNGKPCDFFVQCPGIAKSMMSGVVLLDVVIFSNTRERATAGNFTHVPMLGGSTAQEGDTSVVEEGLLTVSVAVPGLTQEVADIVTKVMSLRSTV